MLQSCSDCCTTYDDLDHRTYCPHEGFEMHTLAVRANGAIQCCHSVAELLDWLEGREVPYTKRTPEHSN